MGKLYERIKEEEIICKDILLPECFPAIYIDEYDNIYCYYGILDKNRFLLKSYCIFVRLLDFIFIPVLEGCTGISLFYIYF